MSDKPTKFPQDTFLDVNEKKIDFFSNSSNNKSKQIKNRYIKLENKPQKFLLFF
jgi:hypothetical protein